MPYLDQIMRMHPTAQLHLWDLTRDPMDQRYLQTLDGAHDGRVRVVGTLHGGHPIDCMYPNGYDGKGGTKRPRGWRQCKCMKHKPPYEQPWKYYAKADWVQPGTVFVKIDDDVLFLETDTFSHLIGPLVEFPNRIMSANVINNSVCAKYEDGWFRTQERFDLGDPTLPKFDRDWWELHTNSEFASFAHAQFLNRFERGWRPSYVRTRPGELVSINCVAMTHPTLKRVAGMMNDRLGDEGAVDRMLPWIVKSFRVAHLSFGPQETMDPDLMDEIRESYIQFRKEYLGR
jgi:hypothetical protein